MVEISLIVPVWNRSDETAEFLHRNWTLYQDRTEVEFVMVNNGSTDGTRQILDYWAKQMGERLIPVHSDQNRGFSGGNNLGTAQANGDTLIFISNDVVPLGDYVTIVQQALTERPDVLAGAELLDFDTGWNTFEGVTIPYLTGWCVAATRATWDALGGWDERYHPCDYEDIDLSQTARQKGIELLPLNLPLRHKHGRTAYQLEGGRGQITMRSQASFLEKWGLTR